jgi:hypothetical protein
VGIANGQVVAVADDLDDMAQRLEQIEPDPARCFSVEASRDYSEVVDIWSLPECFVIPVLMDGVGRSPTPAGLSGR